MNRIRKAEVKQLLRSVFWQLKNCQDEKLVPELVRNFLIKNADHKVLAVFAISVSGSDWWNRIECLCLYYQSVKYWRELE